VKQFPLDLFAGLIPVSFPNVFLIKVLPSGPFTSTMAVFTGEEPGEMVTGLSDRIHKKMM